MATINENLQTLNEAKLAIKTAIENKGVDLTDVPFTEYAEKINDVYSVTKLLNTKVNKSGASIFNSFTDLTDEDLKSIFSGVTTFAPSEISYMFFKCGKITEIPQFDASNVIYAQNTFEGCSSVKSFPWFDFSKAIYTGSMFRDCKSIETIPLYDFSNVGSAAYMFYNCENLKIVPALDFRNVPNLHSVFQWCPLTEVWVRNIKSSIQVASGSTWGHLLTLESLIHLIKELRDTGSLKTLTVGNVNLEKLANVYVRTIEVTDEMRAEDDLIDEKLPFEICESTDEGAMLISDYVALKNWSIA